MSSSLLVQHDEALWSVEHEFAWQAGLITIPVRMTIFRLGDGRLILHSPVPISDALRGEIEALGPIAYLVVPRAHGRFALEVAQQFPDAKLMAAPSPWSRRGAKHVQGSLADEPPAEWSGELESFLVRGFRLDEVVLYQPSSHTLVVTDLCFNIHDSDSGFSRGFFQLNGMWRYFGPSRLIRRLAVSSRATLVESLEKILAWDLDRIVPGHGEIIESGGPEALRAAWRL